VVRGNLLRFFELLLQVGQAGFVGRGQALRSARRRSKRV
jgi:hypothetical protein